MTKAESSFLADLEVRPVSAAIGATIGGIDLSADLGNAAVAAIGTPLDRHRVLFFEDQTLTPRQKAYLAFRNTVDPYNFATIGMPVRVIANS